MTPDATTHVAPKPWLSQGDIFSKLLIIRTGVTTKPEVEFDQGPAILVSHGCSIDKKNRGKSRLEHLTFLPIHNVKFLVKDRQDAMRAWAGNLKPYEAMYLGDVPGVGEAYVSLVEPYTLPALLLQTELKSFTADETGDDPDVRVIPTFHDTRVATLSEEALSLFHQKWSVQWTRYELDLS